MTDTAPTPDRDYDPLLDAALSFHAAIDELRRRHQAGEPVPREGYFAVSPRRVPDADDRRGA